MNEEETTETIRTILVNDFWGGNSTPTEIATVIAERFGLASALHIGAIAQVIRDYRQEGFVKVAEEVYEMIERLTKGNCDA